MTIIVQPCVSQDTPRCTAKHRCGYNKATADKAVPSPTILPKFCQPYNVEMHLPSCADRRKNVNPLTSCCASMHDDGVSRGGDHSRERHLRLKSIVMCEPQVSLPQSIRSIRPLCAPPPKLLLITRPDLTQVRVVGFTRTLFC